jgi:hypothetical protein
MIFGNGIGFHGRSRKSFNTSHDEHRLGSGGLDHRLCGNELVIFHACWPWLGGINRRWLRTHRRADFTGRPGRRSASGWASLADPLMGFAIGFAIRSSSGEPCEMWLRMMDAADPARSTRSRKLPVA